MGPVSLAELAERYRPEILAYLVRLMGNEPDAQDACQEAFLRAQGALDRLRPDSNLRAWLFRRSRSLRLGARGITYFQFSRGCAPISLSGYART